MAKLDTPIAIRRIAMDLLAMREHGRVELTRKLLRKGASPELIEEVLTQLASEGLLSEARYLESYIRSRVQAGYGPLRIQEELAHRGLNRQMIQQSLSEANYQWQDQLYSVWQRKFNVHPSHPKEKATQWRFLAYRGFPHDLIHQLLNDT